MFLNFLEYSPPLWVHTLHLLREALIQQHSGGRIDRLVGVAEFAAAVVVSTFTGTMAPAARGLRQRVEAYVFCLHS